MNTDELFPAEPEQPLQVMSGGLDYSYSEDQIEAAIALHRIDPCAIVRGSFDAETGKKRPLVHWKSGAVQSPVYANMPALRKASLIKHVTNAAANHHAHGIPARFGLLGLDFDHGTEEFSLAIDHLRSKGVAVWAMPGGKGGHALVRIRDGREAILSEFPKGCSASGNDPLVRGTGYRCEIKLLNTLRIADPSVWLEAATSDAEPVDMRTIVEWKREEPTEQRPTERKFEAHSLDTIAALIDQAKIGIGGELRGACPKCSTGKNPKPDCFSVTLRDGKALINCHACGAFSKDDYRAFIEVPYPAPKREYEPHPDAPPLEEYVADKEEGWVRAEIEATGQVPPVARMLLDELRLQKQKKKSKGNNFSKRENAEAVVSSWGAFEVAEDTATDAFRLIGRIGGSVRCNDAHKDIEWCHPRITGGKWIPTHIARHPQSGKQLSDALNRLCVRIKAKKMRGRKEFGGADYETFYIEAATRYRTTGVAVNDDLESLVTFDDREGKSLIPIVHPFAEAFEYYSKKAAEMSPEEQERVIGVSKRWLFEMPDIEVEDEKLGEAFSTALSGGLILRLAESASKGRPFPQRTIPFLVGEAGISKTNMLKALCPDRMEEFLLGNLKVGRDSNKVLCPVVGQWLVILDDKLGAFGSNSDFKATVTDEVPNLEFKYKNARNYYRTDWMAGTANHIQRRNDAAVDDRLLVCNIRLAEGAPRSKMERGFAVRAKLREMHDDIFTGALLRYQRYGIIGLGLEPEGLDHEREIALRSANIDTRSKEDAAMIFRHCEDFGQRQFIVEERGDAFVEGMWVALYLGLLKEPCSRNAIEFSDVFLPGIAPDAEPTGEDYENEIKVRKAYQSLSKEQYARVETALQAMGFTKSDNPVSIKSALTKRKIRAICHRRPGGMRWVD